MRGNQNMVPFEAERNYVELTVALLRVSMEEAEGAKKEIFKQA